MLWPNITDIKCFALSGLFCFIFLKAKAAQRIIGFLIGRRVTS
jgi:hypothetical protein